MGILGDEVAHMRQLGAVNLRRWPQAERPEHAKELAAPGKVRALGES
jgi:hypothetical protein